MRGRRGLEVKVIGHKTIRSMDQTQADKTNEGAPLDISGDANNVVIRIREDQAHEIRAGHGHARNQRAQRRQASRSTAAPAIWISMTLQVPSTITSDNAGVRLKNIGGTARVDLSRSDVVHMSGVKGDVEIKGHGADIELEDIAGPVNVDGTYNGTIELRKLAKPLRFNGPRTNLSIEACPAK